MRDNSEVLLTRFAMEIVVALATMAAGTTVVVGSFEFGIGWGDAGPQPGYFPFYIGSIIILASACVLIQALVQQRRSSTSFVTREQARRIAAFFGPMLGFVLVATLLGLYVALIVYLTATMVVQGRYRLWQALVVSVGSAVVFYAVFEIWFKVPLLKGPLEALLRIH